jgi:hypothetical protein
MKFNKTSMLAVFGSLIVGLSLFVFVGVSNTFACDTNCNVPAPDGYCTASVSTANIGDTVTFHVTPSAGNGYYSYIWSGTDGLSGSAPSVSQSYSTSGTKTATVQIYSGGQSVTRSCSVNVQTISNPGCNGNCNVPAVDGYCTANISNPNVGDNVTYTVYPSGGNGYYSYTWSGTDGLSGSSPTISKSYSYSGSKTAYVQIYSGGQSISRQCSTNVQQNNYNQNFSVSCYANNSSYGNDNNSVTWTAQVNGNNYNYNNGYNNYNGNYSYSWTGTDGLYGSGSTVYKNYYTSGYKTATVTVYGNGYSQTATCNTNVGSTNYNNNLTAYCTASPVNSQANQAVTYTVYPSGGTNNYYTYSWTADDGSYLGSNQSVYKSFSTNGQHIATVTVNSNGQSITAQCATNVNQQTIGGIYLSSIPATGISPTVKTTLFIAGIFLWSAFLAYLYIARRNEKIKAKAMLDSISE